MPKPCSTRPGVAPPTPCPLAEPTAPREIASGNRVISAINYEALTATIIAEEVVPTECQARATEAKDRHDFLQDKVKILASSLTCNPHTYITSVEVESEGSLAKEYVYWKYNCCPRNNSVTCGQEVRLQDNWQTKDGNFTLKDLSKTKVIRE